MDCDRCGNEIPAEGERTMGLTSLRTSYTLRVCQPCDERLRNELRVNTLGRNAGTRELRNMAERLPERGRSIEEMIARRDPHQLGETPEVDEGVNVGEWLKQHGVPETVRNAGIIGVAGGDGKLGLYRLGYYHEPPPNNRRTIVAPRGEPLALLGSMEDPLPPCPECGGEIRWAERGRPPGDRECGGCGLHLAVHPRRDPMGNPWPWQDGRLTPVTEA